MAFESWGGGGGVSAGIGDQLNLAKTMQAFGEIAMQPAHANLLREQANLAASHGRFFDVETQAKQTEAQARGELIRRAQARAMSEAGGPEQLSGPPPEMGGAATSMRAPSMMDQLSKGVQNFTDLANDALELGDFGTATKAFTAASTSGERLLQGHAAAARATKTAQEIEHAKQERVLGILQDSTLPWEQRKALARRVSPPETPEEAARLDSFTEQQVPALARSLMTQREREQSDLTATNNDSMAALRTVSEALKRAETRLADARTRMLDARRSALNKDGEKLKEPTAAEKSSAENVVREAFPQMPKDIKDKPAWTGAVRNVAARAQILQADARKQGKTLSSEEARRAALKEEQDQGTFSTVLPESWENVWQGGGAPTPGGNTPAAPLPMPKDRKDLIRGKVYDTPKGTGRYIGGGQFEAVAAAPQGSKPLTAEEEDLLNGGSSSSAADEED